MQLFPEQDSEAIKAFCAEREIAELVHFTRLTNVSSILSEGLLSRSEVEERFGSVIWGEFAFSDPLRLDGHLQAVNLSMSFPNYRMFFRCREELSHPINWAVLGLSPAILWELPCAFYPGSASSRRLSSEPPAKLSSLAWLQQMFADRDEASGLERPVLEIPRSYPTNPNSEVLVFSRIPASYISRIYLQDAAARLIYDALLDADVRPPVRVGVSMFKARTDFIFWSTPRAN